MLRTFLGLALTLAFSLGGQVLLKRGLTAVLAGSRPTVQQFLGEYLLRTLASPLALAGLCLSAIGVACWLFVLSTLELSRALPVLGGMGYVVLFLIGRYYLKEPTSWLQLLGILAIVAGIALISQRAP